MPVARPSYWKQRCHLSAQVVSLFELRQVLSHSSLQIARLGILRATGYAAIALRSRLTILIVQVVVAAFCIAHRLFSRRPRGKTHGSPT